MAVQAATPDLHLFREGAGKLIKSCRLRVARLYRAGFERARLQLELGAEKSFRKLSITSHHSGAACITSLKFLDLRASLSMCALREALGAFAWGTESCACVGDRGGELG